MKYDLIVIGSGPAGEKGAAQAAYFGKKVALIERSPFLGGAGTNTGTLPSKTLRETALMLSGFRARNLYGVDLSLRRQATVRDFLGREEQVVNQERGRVSGNMQRHGVEVFQGNGSFVDAHTIKVSAPGKEPVTLEGEFILLATGSKPRRPELYAFADDRIWDSDEILQLSFMPKSMAVVGGGVIGCEYACTFAALGAEVHLIDRGATLLNFLDREVAAALEQRMEKLGVKLHLNAQVKTCRATPDAVEMELASGPSEGAVPTGKTVTVPSGSLKIDALLVAQGRVSNTESLNLEGAGLKLNAKGLLDADAFFRTGVPHIYAAGDIIGFPALASTSMEQARLAMVHAFDLKYKHALAPILPYGIYTIPEVSMAGETEQTLAAKKIEYVCGRADYGKNSRGVIIGDYEGFLKLIFKKDDLRLLGVHVIGEQATELVHTGLMVLMAGAGADLFISTCFNYPTLNELYKYATYDALGRLNQLRTTN